MGPIPPLEFIGIAEKEQLMVPLGNLITQKACRFLKNLEMQHFSDTKISINISLIQILRDDFLPNIMEIINETKIRPSSLVLEITESVFSSNYELINQRLKK
ncbi:MAG: EAL domain-containing protein [Actinomycetota bacterium]|nr:EAL domain-containing protein [Actinomycetota bacterium]